MLVSIKRKVDLFMSKANVTITEDDIISVNALLEQGFTLNTLEKTDDFKGLARKTFCNRAKKLGYVFNSEFKQFTKRESKAITITQIKKNNIKGITPDKIMAEEVCVTKETQDSVTNKTQKKHKNNTKNELSLESLNDRLVELEKLVLQLSHSNVTETNDIEVVQDSYDGVTEFILDKRIADMTEIKGRSFKAATKAIDEFDNLCSTKLKAYSKQDLLTQALLEFVDKYK